MKGKHEKGVGTLEEKEILQLMSSRHGLDETDARGADGPSADGPASSRSSENLKKRRSTIHGLRPKKAIVRPDQFASANRLIPSFQLGIEVALTQISSGELRDLLFHDFFFIEIIQFSPSVLNRVDERVESFTLKAYAPMAFAHFRKLFNVQEDGMRSSLCQGTLTMVTNAGGSGSIFYVSPDREFVLKTVTKKEARFLQELLPEYYMNIHQNPSTFLPRFYGMYVVKRYTCVMRLIVMNNIIKPGLVERKFDLKGSRYHRYYVEDGSGVGLVGTNIPTLKDMNFIDVFPNGLMLTPDVYDIVSKTLSRDVLVLQSFDIMDYSLLLAIRKANDMSAATDSEPRGSLQSQRRSHAVTAEESFCEIHQRHNCLAPNCCTRRLTRKLAEIVLPCGGIPAADEHGEPLVIYMGIIDILQDYGIKKITEHFMKAICIRSDISEISVQPPDFYAMRFSNFITQRVFQQVSYEFPNVPSLPSLYKGVAVAPASATAAGCAVDPITAWLFPGSVRTGEKPATDTSAATKSPAGTLSTATSAAGTSDATKSVTGTVKSLLPPTQAGLRSQSPMTIAYQKNKIKLPAVISKTQKIL